MLATSRWILSMMAAAVPAGAPSATPVVLSSSPGRAAGNAKPGPSGRGGWAMGAGRNQGQARAGAVEGEIDGSRQNGLTDLGAALERNELNIDAGAPGEQQRAQPRRDRARAHVELSGIGLCLDDQLLDR